MTDIMKITNMLKWSPCYVCFEFIHVLLLSKTS